MRFRNISRSFLWHNFSSSFSNKTSLKLSDGLKELKQISMPAFLNMMDDYEEVKVKDRSLSWWPYLMGTFGIVTILIAIVCYFKYVKRSAVCNCENGLANLCSDERMASRTARVNGSVMSEVEAVNRKPRSPHPSTLDKGEVALATLLGENSCSGSAQRK